MIQIILYLLKSNPTSETPPFYKLNHPIYQKEYLQRKPYSTIVVAISFPRSPLPIY